MMRIAHRPALAGCLLGTWLLLVTPLSVMADERPHSLFDSQTFASDMRHRDGDQRRHHGDDRVRWRHDRGHTYDGRDFERGHHRHDRDRRSNDGHGSHGYRDRLGSAWIPNVEVIVDGISSDNRQPRHDPRNGPDRCHQPHSDSWSTNTLDCPEPESPSRSREWSSSP